MANDKSRINKIRFSNELIEKIKKEYPSVKKEESQTIDSSAISKIRVFKGNPVHKFISIQKTDNFKQVKSKPSQEHKKCEYCLVSVRTSNLLKHIENCRKINKKAKNEKKDVKRVKKSEKQYSKDFLSKVRTGREIKISMIVEKLNKPSEMIIKLLKNIGLNVTNEDEYVDKIFADSVWLVFNPESKKIPSFEVESEEVSKVTTENGDEETNQKQPQEIYKFCPFCSISIESHKYNLHISENCPKNSSKNANQHTLMKQPKLERKVCPYCLVLIRIDNFVIHINEKCPKNPLNSKKINSDLIVKKTPWTFLPQGDWLFSEIIKHFKKLSLKKKWRSKPFDENRLQKIEQFLKPNKCFIRNDEFEGYIVYCFDWSNKVILECPIYGNAIYLIKEGKFSWQEIAKATKWEARTKYSEQVKVINHSETWLERLEESLSSRY